MTRRKWIYPRDGEPFEVSTDYSPENKSALVFGDLPGYNSPVDGRWVEGKVQRQADLKRTGSRPWEGLDQERKEASRQRAYNDEKLDRQLDQRVHQSLMQMKESERRRLLDY